MLLEEQDRQTGFDFAVFFTALALWGIGLALVYSATHIHTSGSLAGAFRSQVTWVAMGVVVVLLVVSVPMRYYYMFAYVAYGAACLALVAVLMAGVVSKGAGRWISVAGFRIQPSEFAKIGLLLALARYLSERTVSLQRIVSFVVPGLLVLVPFGLVLKQPDLGTAMVFGAIALPLFYWAGLGLVDIFFVVSPVISLVLSGIPLVHSFMQHGPASFAYALPWGLFFISLCVVLYLTRSSGLMWTMMLAVNLFTATITTVLWSSFLRDYQKMRIITFINPQRDPSGAGYQVIQSTVAVGSGHLVGKGWLQGTQTRLSFLPEQHTDFIFSTLGEQFGLAGCAVVLLCFLFLLVKGYLNTQSNPNRFANLLVVGSVSILAFHIFVNIAMTLGMMPVAGVPLPFLSYGGSFTMTVAVLVGFIINARVSGRDF